MSRSWNLPDFKKDTIQQFLDSRNLNNDFLEFSLDSFPNDKLFKDLDKAVKRILSALKNNEKIIVYGHDDLDGITSTFLIFDFLTEAGSANHYFYLPNRIVDRHGLCQNLIDFAVAYEAKLIISVDNGISSVKEIEDLNNIGIETIILDHHIPAEILPAAYAIVNPKQEDCNFPEKMLAGVGVCYFIVRKLCELTGITFKDLWIFWTAVGTIADKVPLVGVNRKIVKYVLSNFDEFLKNDILHFVYIQQKKIIYNPSKMGFINFLIRILYNGRELHGKNKSFQFIIANQFEREILYNELNDIKEQNDTLIKQNLQNIDEMFLNNFKKNIYHLQADSQNEIEENINIFTKGEKPALVIIIDNKHNFAYSLLGIHASYIYSDLKVPVIMIKPKDESHYVAEARGPKWFNLVNCFNYCKESFIQYGGHVKAAGFLIENHNIPLFLETVKAFINETDFVLPEKQSSINIDAVFKNFNKQEIDEFYEQLQPFGQGLTEPIILVENYSYREDDKYYFNNLPEELPQGGLWNLVLTIMSSPE